jgi:hypothetical protein
MAKRPTYKKTMKTKLFRSTFKNHPARSLVAVFIALLVFGDPAVFAQEPATAPTTVPAQEAQDAPKIPNDQLDSLVAPIALYPDPLLSQVLVASTYPLEVIQLQQYLAKTAGFLSEKAVTEAVQKEDWDPSVQAMAALPSVVKRMAENIKWTTDLGNAFLAQEADVMAAVQRMRTKARDAGKLQSNEQVKVETKEVASTNYVVIEQARPEVVYVPSYDPTWVWGVSAYPYPPFYGGYYSGAAIWYGSGIAIGVAWGGGWGWGAGWGYNNININVNNRFVNHYNNTNINRGGNRINSGKWQHNAQHRGGAPYGNRATAQRYGGAGARQNLGNLGGNRPQAGNMNLSGLSGGGRDLGANRGNLGGGGRQAGNMDLSGLRGSGGSGLGGDRIGSRDVSRGFGSGQRNMGSFGGSGSFGSGAARASSMRGASSMGGGYGGGRGFGGGGGMRGGGMRGGGRRR